MLKDLPLCLQTSTDAWAWCYVKRSSLVLAQTLDATLQGAGLPGWGTTIWGGVAEGSRPGGPYHRHRGGGHRAADRDHILGPNYRKQHNMT